MMSTTTMSSCRILCSRVLILCIMSMTTAVTAWQSTPHHPPRLSMIMMRKTTTTRLAASTDTPSSSSSSSSSASSSSSSSFSRINPLLSRIQPSQTVEIFSRVKEMQARGVDDVTSLCVGEPDFDPPDAVTDAVRTALRDGDTRYTAVAGTLTLRTAVADDLRRRRNVSYDPASEIVVGNGAKQCVYQGVLATAGVGDAVLIPAPYWPSYPEMARLCGARPVVVETSAEDGYLLTADALRTALQRHDDVRLFILCNPSNPTGGVYGRPRLEELAAVLRDYPRVTVLADEIYERLSYHDDDDDEAVTSFASLSTDMWERTLTVNGFSKAYAMTGFRLGYLAAPAALTRAVTTIQSQFTSCAGSISQAAGVAALTRVPDSVIRAHTARYRERRDYVLRRLGDMSATTVAVPPMGAFYVLPVIDRTVAYGTDDVSLCRDLLESERLALVPGTSFGAPGTVRISYATSMDELRVAMDKLSRFLDAHP